MQRKILVIDENPSSRSVLCNELSTDFHVLESGGGLSGRKMLADCYRSISAVVFCVDRTAEDAQEGLNYIKNHAILNQLPVVIVADKPDSETEYTLLKNGANDYVARAVDPRILRQRIGNLINLKEMSAIGNDFSRSKQTAQRLQAIMDHVDCGITATQIKDGNVRIVFSNNRFYEMLGYTKETYNENFAGRYGPIFSIDRKRVEDARQEICRTKKPLTLTYRAVKADGQIIWVRQHLTVTKMLGVTGDIQLGALYDITAETRASDASRAKSDFLSWMSHDMRTPMNTILGMVSLCEYEDNPPATREYLANIDQASHYLLELINDVLDLSKIESGRMELHEAPYPAEEFSRFIQTMIMPMMAAKGVQLECTAKCGMVNIVVDKLRFNQIFLNLLSNAAKYTPKGGHVTLLAEAIPDVGGKHGMRFRIQDDGIGMTPEFLRYVFEPFTQEKRQESLSVLDRSSGLGLAIVKSIVEKMGGTISVTSRLDQGTEFVVDLYAYEAKREDFTKREQIESYQMLDKLEILLVEDNEMNILVTRKLLEKKGSTVTVARNGLEAVELFAASSVGQFGAVLMDVRMDAMDGLEATRRIRALDRVDAWTVPIIAMTADAFVEDQSKTLECGMNVHLTKPIDPNLLYATISEMALR